MAFCVRRFNSTGYFIDYSAAFQQRRKATAGRKGAPPWKAFKIEQV